MLDFFNIGYEIRQLFDQIKVLIPIKTERTIAAKTATSNHTLRDSSSPTQNPFVPSKKLYEKSVPNTLHFQFHSASPIESALKDLWYIYSSLYQLINTGKKDIHFEFEKIINLIEKLAFKLSFHTSQKKIAEILNSIKIIHEKIQNAVYESYQKVLVIKIFSLLEIELNEDMTQYVHVLKTLSNESFYVKMQKTISFLLRKVVKKYSAQKTISTIEKSFLTKLNINEISKEYILGVQQINFMTNLTQEYGGIYLKYFKQQQQSTYTLLGGGCAGSVIYWGIELLSSISTERGNASMLLVDSKEMLTSFICEKIPSSIKSLNFLGGEPIFNKQLNLYQLLHYEILSNNTTLNEFNLLNDGPVSENIFSHFSKDEKESILAVNFLNTSATASNDQKSHFIGLAKVGNDDNVLYYVSDAEWGVFNFNDKNKFIEFFVKYCKTMQYDQYDSYWIMDINPVLKEVIEGKVALPSKIEDILESFAMLKKRTAEKEVLADHKELPRQSEEKAPLRKVAIN